MRRDEITLKNRGKVMNTHWGINGAGMGISKYSDDDELVLVSFEGTCCKRRKQGHKAFKCRENNGSRYDRRTVAPAGPRRVPVQRQRQQFWRVFGNLFFFLFFMLFCLFVFRSKNSVPFSRLN